MISTFLQDWSETTQRLTNIQQRYLQTLRNKDKVNQQGINAVLQDAMHSYSQFCVDNIKHPFTLMGIEKRLLGKHLKLCTRTLLKAVGKEQEAVISANKSDHRFKHELWNDKLIFDFIKQSYLLISEAMEEGLDSLDGDDKRTKRRIAFYNRQILNALSPSNFILTNPELLKLTWDSKGQNLVKGMERYLQDLEHSASILNIRMTSKQKFKLGENIATTPGKVVYKNDLFELIHFKAQSKSVAKEPLLMIPPFVNKYYILDLTKEKSFVRWAVEQGQNVFLVSWVNPDTSHQAVGFENYMADGVIEAAKQVHAISGEKDINALGYCIGGTVLASALAYLKEKPERFHIKSATFLTTLLDFEDSGDIDVFIDEAVINSIQKQNNKNGVFDGRLLSVSFSLMRENTLYWNYFVQNYLKGEDPAAFDLLYWNSDSTNICARTHNFMLEELYLNNNLAKPGGVTLNEVKINLANINTPCYFISTHLDHIAYWKTCYRGAQLLNSDVTFVLGESGHIAGIVNPPEKHKYSYYVNQQNTDIKTQNAEQWLEGAEQHAGSWWPNWEKWLSKHNSKQVPVKTIEESLADAPGEYVCRQLA